MNKQIEDYLENTPKDFKKVLSLVDKLNNALNLDKSKELEYYTGVKRLVDTGKTLSEKSYILGLCILHGNLNVITKIEGYESSNSQGKR